MKENQISASQHPAQENFFWVDLLKVIATWCVILIHIAADVITEWRAVPSDWWWAANVYDSVTRGAVVIFIMLSGAMLLPGSDGHREFFRKRFGKVLIPFLAWSALYLLWHKIFYKPEMTWGMALERFATDHVHFHLWFLYVIIGLYLITPLLRVWLAHASQKDAAYFLGLCFVVSSLVPFGERLAAMMFHVKWHLRIPIEAAQGFIGYFVLGYFIRRYSSRKVLPWACWTWLVSLLICTLGTYWVCLTTGKYGILFYDNMAPNVVFYAAAFFILAYQCSSKLERLFSVPWRGTISTIAKASFGIYLIHPMMIDVLIKGRLGFVMTAKSFHPAYMILLMTVIVFLSSTVLTLFIQRIPYLRRTV